MHNLAKGLPQRHKQAQRNGQVQAATAVLLALLAIWPLTRLPTTTEAAPLASTSNNLRVSRLPVQPWQQHLQLWQQLGQLPTDQTLLTQLDYSNGRWTFYLQINDLAVLGPWLDNMRQHAGLALDLRSAESRQGSFRIIVDGLAK